MKKRSTLTTVVMMSVLLITSLVGQVAAQDRGDTKRSFNTSSLEETYLEDEAQVEELMEVQQPGAKNPGDFSTRFVSSTRLHSGACQVGPRSGDIIFKCFGFNFASPYPRNVFCQMRQGPGQNLDFGWPDQFSCQIIETSRDFVRFRIRRIDNGTGSSGWGQDLRADLLIID